MLIKGMKQTELMKTTIGLGNVIKLFFLTKPGINTPVSVVVLVAVVAVCGSCCGIHLAFAVDNETIANVVVFVSDFALMYKEKVA